MLGRGRKECHPLHFSYGNFSKFGTFLTLLHHLRSFLQKVWSQLGVKILDCRTLVKSQIGLIFIK